jgi:hypothetical protein
MRKMINRKFTTLLIMLAVGFPLTVFAVSYPPAPLYHREYLAETVIKAGQTVYLFHSGTEEVRMTIQNNDILTVYRINPFCEVKTVGKIKIISHVGDTYLKGEVIEGEIKPDDIAKKGNVSCLVISAGMCNP